MHRSKMVSVKIMRTFISSSMLSLYLHKYAKAQIPKFYHPYLEIHLLKDVGWRTHTGYVTCEVCRALGIAGYNLSKCPEGPK